MNFSTAAKSSFVKYQPPKTESDYSHVYWKSSLFNEVYLRIDLPKESFWQNDEFGEFEDFRRQFHDLCVEINDTDQPRTWNEADTIKNWIIPVMKLLGWEDKCKKNQTTALENVSFTVRDEEGIDKRLVPDLLYVDDPSEKKLIGSHESSGNLPEARKSVQMIVEAKYWERLTEHKASRKVDPKKEKIIDDIPKSVTPEAQIIKYIQVLKKDFGILTDGNTWRLLHRELSKRAPHRNLWVAELD